MTKQVLTTAFKRMKRRGIVVPTIKTTDNTTKSVASIYEKNFDLLEKDLLKNLAEYNVESKNGVIVKDSFEGLIEYLRRSDMMRNFSEPLQTVNKYEQLKRRLNQQFDEAIDHFFRDFFEDADANSIVTIKYKLNKDEVFKHRLKVIKSLYIDNAVKRIDGEQNDLKKNFLEKMIDYVEGDAKKLDIKDLVKQMKKTSVKEARFFARDQFCKFNKALLIASFKEADVTKVKLITCMDAAVRKEHKAWNNKIYRIDEIPQEWYDDYNCRCGAIAVEYESAA